MGSRFGIGGHLLFNGELELRVEESAIRGAIVVIMLWGVDVRPSFEVFRAGFG